MCWNASARFARSWGRVRGMHAVFSTATTNDDTTTATTDTST